MRPDENNNQKQSTSKLDQFNGLYNDLPMPGDNNNQLASTPTVGTANSTNPNPNVQVVDRGPLPAQDVKRRIPDQPLSAIAIETPKPATRKSSPVMKDIFGIAVFILVVVIGAFLINTFIFRSFNVVGPSMEPTLDGGVNDTVSDRLIVNRVPVTIANLSGHKYTPERGTIVVFKNPLWTTGQDDEYVVKRVIGLPGERVTVNNCELKVHNSDDPDGFNPYPGFKNLASNDSEINTCVEGDGTDVTVPDGQIFVVGDHRVNGYSMDSRNGGGRSSLGTIPFDNIVGPVAIRIWPLNLLKIF